MIFLGFVLMIGEFILSVRVGKIIMFKQKQILRDLLISVLFLCMYLGSTWGVWYNSVSLGLRSAGFGVS